MRGTVERALTPVLLAWLLAGCDPASPSPPASPPTIGPTAGPSQRQRPTEVIGASARGLLATLPEAAGGETFDGVQVVSDSLNVFVPVDDVLDALGKERRDAVSVSRNSNSATISATRVEGIDGPALLGAFVATWGAPGVIRRRSASSPCL
jgi:hypothetical protein